MRSYFEELKNELSKVTWPKRSEVTRLTAVIIMVSGIFGIFIGILDFSFVKLLEYLVAR